MINLLLKNGANPNLENYRYGRTPLHYAVDYERVKSVALMMTYDANAYQKDKNGTTAIDIAKTPEMLTALTEPSKIE